MIRIYRFTAIRVVGNFRPNKYTLCDFNLNIDEKEAKSIIKMLKSKDKVTVNMSIEILKHYMTGKEISKLDIVRLLEEQLIASYITTSYKLVPYRTINNKI